MSDLNRSVTVRTPRQEYKGIIVGELYKSGSFYVKITEVSKGTKKIGQTGKFSYRQVHF
jgi:hypothetical protein